MMQQVEVKNIHCLWITLLLVVLSFTYLKITTFDFTYDDQLTIVENPLVNDGVISIERTIEIFSSPYRPGTLYRPVTTLSYLLNCSVTGLNSGLFHLVNLLLHFLVGLLAYCLLTKFIDRSISIIFGIGIWFIHPLNAEVLGGVVGRAEILTALFALSSTCLFIKSLSKKSSVYELIATLLFCLSVLSKESGSIFIVITPLLVLVLSRSPQVALRYFIFLALGLLVCIALRYAALGADLLVRYPPDIKVAANPLINTDLIDRILPSLQLLGKYLIIAIFPVSLSADYSLSPLMFQELFLSFPYLILALVPLLLGLLCLRTGTVCISLFTLGVIALLPVLNLLTPIGTLMGERLLYLPAIGFILSVVLVFERFISKKYQYLCLVPVVVTLGTLTFTRLDVWRDNETLFSATVKDAPLSPKAHLNFALNRYEKGKTDDAKDHALKAEELFPGNPDVARLLFKIALDQEEIQQALYWGTLAITRAPEDAALQAIFQHLLAISNGKI